MFTLTGFDHVVAGSLDRVEKKAADAAEKNRNPKHARKKLGSKVAFR